MNQEVKLKAFPSNCYEALTMLYLQNQDLSSKTPEEIHTLYWETLYDIRRDYSVKQSEGFFDEL